MALMITPKRLATTLLTTSAAAIYTAPEGTTARIFKATLWNSSPDEETYSFWAPQSGSATTANLLADTHAIASDDDVEVSVLKELVIEPGGTLIAQASTDSVLTLVISGIEVTES